MKEYFKSFDRRAVIAVFLAFLIGAFWVLAIRFVTLERKETHYHANFAVFVNGERLPFDRFTFYEEVQACGGDELNNPKTRGHMHDNVNHVVHVHDTAVTWGHFFANLGFTAGDTVFKTDSSVFVEGRDDIVIRYKLNGEEVDTIANRTIRSEDVLLVSIGNPSDQDLADQFAQITQDAGDYNKRNDPSNCTGGKPLTLTERIKETLGL